MMYFFKKNKLCINYVTILILFSSILYLFNLGKRDLWEPDEPRYSQVSKEMWESKDFILPHLNGEKYPDKPPVLFWLIVVLSIPFGEITEFSARLPSALAGIGCVVIIYFFGKEIFSSKSVFNKSAQWLNHENLIPFSREKLSIFSSNPQRIGLLAGLVLATSIKFLVVSRRVSFDGLLTLFLLLSLFCFYKGFLQKEKGAKYFLVSYFFMSIATITKGPIGFALPFLIIFTFICILKIKYHYTEFHTRDLHIGWGIVIVFIIPILWVYGIYIQGGWEHTKEVVFTQNIGRTVNSWSHKRPFYYFFIQFPLFFLPWSVFIPAVILYYLKATRKKIYPNIDNMNKHYSNSGQQNSCASRPYFNPGFILITVWFLVVFTFFSIMSGKKSTYILPLYPAASLFIAWFLDFFIILPAEDKLKKMGLITFKCAYILLIFIGIAFPAWVYYYYCENFLSILPLPLIFICVIFISYKNIFESKITKALKHSFILILITVMLGSCLIIPLFNNLKSAKPFCNKINNVMDDNDKLAFLSFFRAAYLFYTKNDKVEVIKDMKKLNEFMGSKERVYLLLKDYHLELLIKGVNSKVFTVLEGNIGHRKMVLVSNKPDRYY